MEGNEVVMIKTSASLLASNLCNLSGELDRCRRAGVNWIHFDVMDGIFVPQITFGSPVLKYVRKATNLPLDVHLMVENPTNQIEQFVEAGADLIDIHVESYCDTATVLKNIKSHGKKAAIAMKPKTPIEAIFPYLQLVDMVLVMTVEPGYGGQTIIPETLQKISSLRRTANNLGLRNMDIQVDGGINPDTVESVKRAGANVIVSGTSLFNAQDMASADAVFKK